MKVRKAEKTGHGRDVLTMWDGRAFVRCTNTPWSDPKWRELPDLGKVGWAGNLRVNRAHRKFLAAQSSAEDLDRLRRDVGEERLAEGQMLAMCASRGLSAGKLLALSFFLNWFLIAGLITKALGCW